LEEERINLEKEEVERRERMNNISIRVYYQGKDKNIAIKKNDTLRELKLKVMQEFEVTCNEQDARIRSYSPHYEMM